MPFNVVTKSARAPTIAVPGSKGNSRPTAQKGGGGNKAAGSVEPTAATAPTVSVSPTGQVTTQNFAAPQAARRATRQANESRQRVQRVRRVVRSIDQETTPKRELHVSKAFLDKAESPKPVTVAAHTRALPGATKPSVPVAKHQRALPTYTKAEKAVVASGKPLSKAEARQDKQAQNAPEPGQSKEPKPKGSPQERQAVRAELEQAKKAVKRTNTAIPTKSNGTLEPKEIAALLAQQNRKQGTGLTPQQIAEGVGVAEAESGGNSGNFGQGPEGHIGLYSESPAFGSTGQRLNPRAATAAAVKEVKNDGGWQQAWGQYETGETEGSGPERASQYVGVTKEALAGKSNPQALQNYQAAATKAKSLGMKVGPALPDVQADPGTHTIKVKATAKGAVEWAESQINVQENSGKQLKWAANFGLEAGGPWCANMVSNNLARRGFTTSSLPANPNYTPSYEEWGAAGLHAKDIGTNLADAKPGDVLTFSGDHTAMYAGNGEMISGNFSNEVMKTPVSEGPAPLSMIIRPDYKGGFVTVKESTPLPGTTSATGTLTGSAAPAAVSAVSSTNSAPSNPKNGKPVAGKTLTAMQQIKQNVRKLRALGTEIAGPGEETKAEAANKPGSSSLHQQLKDLESKYKIGAV